MSAAAAQLGWWQVPAFEYDADESFALLQVLQGLDAALGATTRYLIEVAAFAADLVGRGRLLPSVDADGPRAVWRPVLAGPASGYEPPAFDERADGSGWPATATTRRLSRSLRSLSVGHTLCCSRVGDANVDGESPATPTRCRL